MKEKVMCKQRVALEMLISQNDRGGLSKGAILLHQKQCEDTEAMQKKMTELEKKVDSIDRKFDDLLEKLSESEKFINILKGFLGNKVVQAIIASVLAAKLGADTLPQLLEFLK